VPTATLVGTIEQLGLSLDVVSSFRGAHKWPNGPCEPKDNLQVFASALGKTIAGAILESSLGSMVADSLLIRFWGAPALRVAHDQSLPQSLCVQVSAEVPSNKSLERTREG
jgi:hypothetical protein